MTRKLDPEAEAALDRLAEACAPPLHTLSVAGARQLLLDLSDTDPTPVADETVRDLQIAGPEGTDLDVRVYRPNRDGDMATLIYCHGGGWALGGLDSVDPLCRLLAVEAGIIVISVGYRRTPEHSFPAALRDVYTVLEWTEGHVEPLAGDPDRIAIGGDSAGGNLAAAVTLMTRDFDGPSLDCQLLVYPVLDCAFDTASYEENAEGYYLTRADMEWFWEMYLDDPLHASNPYAAPARHPDLSGLPPAYILTCEFDPLRSEGKSYADRLRAADVPVTYANIDGMIHGFFRHVTRMDAAEASATEAARYLRANL